MKWILRKVRLVTYSRATAGEGEKERSERIREDAGKRIVCPNLKKGL